MRNRSKLEFTVRPTFPLDAAEIKRRSVMAKIEAPLNWAALVAFGAIGLVAQVDPPLLAAGTLGLAGGLTAYWAGKGKEIEAKVIREMIADSNDEQDRELRRIMEAHTARGDHQYAVCLGKFLLVKQRIEHDLHADGSRPTKIIEDIERLVDELCSGVCEHLEKVTRLERTIGNVLTSHDRSNLDDIETNRRNSLDQIMHAYTTLCRTCADLEKILDPLVALEDPLSDGNSLSERRELAQIVDELEEENAMAKRVFDRLRDGDTSDTSTTTLVSGDVEKS